MTRSKYLNCLPPPVFSYCFPLEVLFWRMLFLPWKMALAGVVLQAESLPCATEPLSSTPIFCMDCLTSADIIKSLPDDWEIAARLRGEGSWEGSVKRGPEPGIVLMERLLEHWFVLVTACGFRGAWAAEISPALVRGSFLTSNSGLDLGTRGWICQCLKCRWFFFFFFCCFEDSASCSHTAFSPWISENSRLSRC